MQSQSHPVRPPYRSQNRTRCYQRGGEISGTPKTTRLKPTDRPPLPPHALLRDGSLSRRSRAPLFPPLPSSGTGRPRLTPSTILDARHRTVATPRLKGTAGSRRSGVRKKPGGETNSSVAKQLIEILTSVSSPSVPREAAYRRVSTSRPTGLRARGDIPGLVQWGELTVVRARSIATGQPKDGDNSASTGSARGGGG
eukprot:1192616-Prorocentrum_minimum.AAC.2